MHGRVSQHKASPTAQPILNLKEKWKTTVRSLPDTPHLPQARPTYFRSKLRLAHYSLKDIFFFSRKSYNSHFSNSVGPGSVNFLLSAKTVPDWRNPFAAQPKLEIWLSDQKKWVLLKDIKAERDYFFSIVIEICW